MSGDSARDDERMPASDVLIACPDVARADAAIALARVLAPDPSARWTVATALASRRRGEPTPLDVHRAHHRRRVVRMIAERAAAPADAEVRVLLDHRPGFYTWAAYCDAERPVLVVFASSRDRPMLPDVDTRLAATAGVAVAMSPRHGAPPGQVRSVGVIFTMSSASRDALHHAARLAAFHQADLRILAHPGRRDRRAAARTPRRQDRVLERLEAEIAVAWLQLPWKPTASAVLRCEPLARAVDDEVRRGIDILVMPVPDHRGRLTTARAIGRLAAVAGCAVITVPARPTVPGAPPGARSRARTATTRSTPEEGEEAST